jgi:hypothetical protein
LKKLVRTLLTIICIPSLFLGGVILAGFAMWAFVFIPAIIFGGEAGIMWAIILCIGVFLMLVGWLALKALEKL